MHACVCYWRKNAFRTLCGRRPPVCIGAGPAPQGAKFLKWPKEQVEEWGPWALTAGFAGILVW